MIVRNSRVLYFLILIFSVVNIFALIIYGYVSIFVISFQLLIILVYVIFKPNRTHFEKNLITIYYIVPPRVLELNSERIICFKTYRHGAKAGGGYMIKVKYRDDNGKKKKITLLESISERKKIEIIEQIKAYGFVIEKEG